MEDKKREISEKKEDYDSTMNANPEKELLKDEMLKKSTSPPFPQALYEKKRIRNASEILEYKDPGNPTISIMIGRKVVEKALLDLGASVNLLPYSVYKQLGLDFIVLDTDPTVKEANLVPIILGRPFLLPQMQSSTQTTPEEEEGPEEVCIIDTLVEEHCNQNMQDKLNESLGILRKEDHFPLPFIDQVLERVSGHPFYCFLDGYSGYFQIEIDVEDQEKTTFTCPFGTYAYRRMPFGLCNAPATFQRCMLSIFSDMVERIMEVFMDDITVYGGTFEECLVNLEAVLHRCIEKDWCSTGRNAILWYVKELSFGHIISEKGIEVDKAKVELIVKLSSLTTIKGVRQFLGHAGFYRRFNKGFSGVVLGQREDGKPYVIYYASKTLNEAQRNYTTTEKELLAVVFALDKFRCLFEFDLQIRDKKGVENVVADHLSRPLASQKTAMKVLQSGFTWPSLFKDAHIMCRSCDRCQRLGRLTKRNQMPMNPILIVELFDVWGIDFMGPFPMSFELSKEVPRLNEMEELKNDAYINSKVAKQRMKKWHDQLISNKEFQKGQRVLLYDTRLHIFLIKLKSRWIGPFIIHQVHINGVVELLNSSGKDTFRVNGYRLKPFMEPFKPEKEEINLLEPQKA
ncbi:Retrovirus-related Pol polyprotein from transposon 297 [Vitis vinifera]|uniref:RNA-directed DNA polymerase n=1 Tax=Vitis vinifera TaxID=29760 RepID=A0A438CIE3_VITVI|nr:Retrovirus-related Pol polyprotein from transposon 297 [Vitis vinifera]